MIRKALYPFCALIPVLALLSWIGAGAPAALAQQGFAESLGGFSQDSDEPIAIEADQLEVRDEEGLATFIGNVVVRQGDVTLTASTLNVYYTGSAQERGTDQEGGAGQEIDRLEAIGGVVVTSGDQKASGDRGVFEAKTEVITLTGNVVLTQGANVLRGTRMVVDLAAGTSRVFSEGGASSGGRVQGLFTPNRDQQQ